MERKAQTWGRILEDTCCGILRNVFYFSLSCPFLGAQSIDFFAYKIPIIFLLGVNSFFLVWIMVVCTIQSSLLTAQTKNYQINIEHLF